MARGNERKLIVLDGSDLRRFVDTLEEACGKTGSRIHSWVLMGNHYHLLLETPEANLVAGMRWFQGTWTAVGNSWIARRVHCGHPSNIPRYVKTVKDAKKGSRIWKGRKLLDCED